MTTETTSVSDAIRTRAALMRALDRGIIGDPEDYRELKFLLLACVTVEDMAAWGRMVQRWEYATTQTPVWIDWQFEMEATRN